MKISLAIAVVFVVALAALSAHAQEYSRECSGQGILQYGRCHCRPDFHGDACECSGHDTGNHCFGPGTDSNVPPCSGRGTCVCGICECEPQSNPDQVVSGQYCECDNFSCDRHEGLLCSGADHGICECGRCRCKPQYNLPACQVSSASSSY